MLREDIKPSVTTPVLQSSEINLNLKLHDGLPSFGLSIRQKEGLVRPA
jgi:hypothetical protein